MDSWLEYLAGLIAAHPLGAYMAIFLLGIPEGPKLMVFCGFLSQQGLLNPLFVYLAIVAGDVVGDSSWYAVGRFGRRALLPCIGGFVGVTPARLAHVREHFETHSLKLLAASKFIWGPGLAGIIVAGGVRYSYPRFVLGCFVLSLVQAAVLLVVGLVFGDAFERVVEYLNGYAKVGVVIALCVALVYGAGFVSTKLLPNLGRRKKDKDPSSRPGSL